MVFLRTVIGLLAFGLLLTGGYALAATASVSLTAKGPEPATVSIDWGDTVVFSNGDTVDHGVTSQRAGMTSPTIPPGGTFEHRFDGRAGPNTFVQTGTRPTFSGVVVLTVSGEVTLKTSTKRGAYGSNVTLSGRSTYAGTPVVIQIRYAGATGDWATLMTLPTGVDGSYSGRFRLTAGGRLRARTAADQLSSDLQDVAVLPRIRARVARSRVPKGARVVITVQIVPAAAADSVDLEERVEGRRGWLRKSTKAVPESGKVKFVFKAARGRTQLRLSLKRGALEPGFEPIVSKSMLVIGF